MDGCVAFGSNVFRPATIDQRRTVNGGTNLVMQKQLLSSMIERDWSLTHWGRVTHICVGNLAIIGSDNGVSPGRRQAIIWTNVGILLIGTLGTNFSEILIEILIFSSKKMRLKVSFAKRRPFCLGLNVLLLLHVHAMITRSLIQI